MSDVLTIRGLTVDYPVRSGLLTSRKHRAVTDVDLTISAGQTVALVGESGSGKTSVARAIVGLAPISAGSIALSDQLLDRRGSRRLRQIRRTVQMVFQQPGGSLDPRMSVADTLEEPLHYLMHLNSRAIRARVSELLGLVGLGQQHLTRRPRELSGGQRQRVAIARAIAISPSLVICDEPTSSLDVSVQAQIINLLSRLQQELHLAYLFISHDLGVVRQIADVTAVMHLGRIVETGPTERVLDAPRDDYTRALLSAVPSIEREASAMTDTAKSISAGE
ncbi:MAG: ABC transporter ATP-binding protein [Chloroflexi bacterium]|nr:MAG: ABC transporter ATP-binding protein [Chloroflexota bacterium]TMC29778.1 MAG: ABC transporter ATP-binding protein [Chloroflexota bacterium]TMC32513.1 MAG: ABC transporter ATP-binding protein [Chloroflexota bacterium]TMC56034.1 MAG: ABC transporter ATP-binding protein [Chloroflexota bacterium]TME37060.1 MAG: ABC transporter ATP-binding protein [Chloroflexota bacterium]